MINANTCEHIRKQELHEPAFNTVNLKMMIVDLPVNNKVLLKQAYATISTGPKNRWNEAVYDDQHYNKDGRL